MSAAIQQDPTPEFSLVLSMDDVPPNGKTLRFEVGESERAALARRFDLVALHGFKGTVHVKPWRRHGLVMEGQFEADLVQSCIATLEPLEAHLSESFNLHFLPLDMIERDAAAAAKREIVVDVESEDPPEAIEGGRLDVGEVMAEQLSVAIDPYPKKPGAVFIPEEPSDDEAVEFRPNPFASLEKLKKKD